MKECFLVMVVNQSHRVMTKRLQYFHRENYVDVKEKFSSLDLKL